MDDHCANQSLKRQIAWRDVKCRFRKVRQPEAVLMGLFVTGRFPVVLV